MRLKRLLMFALGAAFLLTSTGKPVAVANVTATLISYFSGIWNSFISLFSAAVGPKGWIVGAIIALIGAACISTLVTMLIMGYQKKGFAVGWKVHNLFNWEWYCEESN